MAKAKGRILFTDNEAPANGAYKPKILFTDDEEQAAPESKGFLGNAIDYEKSLGLGLLQGGGDVAASIGNFPADIWEHFKGEKPYHIPHPKLQQYYPEGMAGKIGSTLGEGIGQFAIPGTGTIKAVKAVNNPLVKALMGMTAGGLTNAAANEGDRVGAGITGAALGGAGTAVGEVGKGISKIPFTKGIASKALKQAEKLVGDRGVKDFKISKDIFKESKDFLPKNLPSKKLLEAAKKGDYKTLFTLQSDLGKTARELTNSASGADRLHGMQAHDLRQRLIDSMKEHLSKQGHEDISKLLTKGQKKYAQHKKYVEPITKQIPKATLGVVGGGGIYELIKHML